MSEENKAGISTSELKVGGGVIGALGTFIVAALKTRVVTGWQVVAISTLITIIACVYIICRTSIKRG